MFARKTGCKSDLQVYKICITFIYTSPLFFIALYTIEIHSIKQESDRINDANFKHEANPKFCYKATVARQFCLYAAQFSSSLVLIQ